GQRSDRPGGRGPLGAAAEDQPRTLEGEDAGEVLEIEEVTPRRLGAVHRLRVHGVEARSLLDRGLGPREELDVVAELGVAPDLLTEARAEPALPRRVVHLHYRALRGPREAGIAPQPVPDEDADQAGVGPIDLAWVDGPRASVHGGSRIAVGRSGVREVRSPDLPDQ